MTPQLLLWTAIKIAIMLAVLINAAALLTWVDRRLSSMIQDRVGPNRAGLVLGKLQLRVAGLLHTAADGLKFFFKKDFMPPKADKLLFSLAPMIAMASVLGLVAVIPFGDTITLGALWKKACVGGEGTPYAGQTLAFLDGHCVDAAKKVVEGAKITTIYPYVSRAGISTNGGIVDLTIAPLNIGILYVFALAGQGIVGAAIAGWSSDNKFSLMGALRAASQMVSYEVAMGLSLVGAMMIYGTVRLDEMVRWQGENSWGIFVQPLAFFLFFACAIAESKRIPFDLPEAESELVSGYFTEYSGMKFGMFYFAEYMEIVTSSMLLVTIFLGGWQLPFLHRDGLTIEFGDAVLFHTKLPHVWVIIFGVLAFFGKVVAMCLFQAFVRWTLPRFRYDQLMKLGWRVILPASLGNILVTGVAWLALDQAGESAQATLKLLGHITQGTVALAITVFFVSITFGFIRSPNRKKIIFGTSGEMADKNGGVITTPMQA